VATLVHIICRETFWWCSCWLQHGSNT